MIDQAEAAAVASYLLPTAGTESEIVEQAAIADLFTNDSKVNDKNIIRQFQVQQKQMQDAAYVKEGRAFGCYGAIEEE